MVHNVAEIVLLLFTVCKWYNKRPMHGPKPVHTDVEFCHSQAQTAVIANVHILHCLESLC